MNRRKYPNIRPKPVSVVPVTAPREGKRRDYFLTATIGFLTCWIAYKAQGISVSQACITRIDAQGSAATEKTGKLAAALSVFVTKTINPKVTTEAYFLAGEQAIYAARELAPYVTMSYRQIVLDTMWGAEDLMQISANLKPKELQSQSLTRFTLLNIGFDEYKRSMDEDRRKCTGSDLTAIIGHVF